MIYKITSKTNQKVKEFISLYDAKTRNEKGLFLVEGYHLVEMAELNKNLVAIITTKEDINYKDYDQFVVTDEVLEKISKVKSPQGIIGICHILKEKPTNNKCVFLDGVSDPGNVGTILRTALAFGFKTVMLSENCVSIYNDKVISASQGSIFDLNIISNVSLTKLKSLKNEGFQIISTALRNSENIEKIKPENKFILVFGNEARGVSKEVLDISDKIAKIEINSIESLNVAVSAGISMFLFK